MTGYWSLISPTSRLELTLRQSIALSAHLLDSLMVARPIAKAVS